MLSMNSFHCLAVLVLLTSTNGLVVDPKYKDPAGSSWPLLVPLLRESVPVIRNGVTVSYKTSYSGNMSIGRPAQDFRVVFDTGSAHVVVPASSCKNETCLEHRRYDHSQSSTSHLVNVDGRPVPRDELCDQVTVGYGTGMITGEFVREEVCPGNSSAEDHESCVEVNIVMAVDMTSLPFRSFTFDGIFGLALDSLALSPEFSFFNRLANSKTGATARFGVFLTDEGGEQSSEISLGGYNTQRVLTPLQWAPVAMAHLGYWQVSIKEVRIGGKPLDICKDGTCRGIVDTGTSHLGIPGPHLSDFMDRLSVDTGDATADCRKIDGQELEIVVEGDILLHLNPEHYMRPLSLSNDDGVPAVPTTNSSAASVAAGGFVPSDQWKNQIRTCAPRLMPVNLPDPLGPNLFILGEPVLHRYYTVYDWAEKRIGFGMSASTSNKKALAEGRLPADQSTISFMQVTLKLTVRGRKLRR